MTTCNKCHGLGLMPVKNLITEEEELTPCDCSKERFENSFKTKKYENAHIPRGFLSTELKDINELIDSLVVMNTPKHSSAEGISKNRASLKQLTEIIQNPKEHVANGIGTTWIYNKNVDFRFPLITSVITKSFCDENIRIRFFKMKDLLVQLLNYKDIEKYSELESIVKTYDVFVIENVFSTNGMTHSNSSYVLSSLYHFFDTATSYGVKLICTSDKSLNDVADEYRGISTLLQYSINEIVFVGGGVANASK